MQIMRRLLVFLKEVTGILNYVGMSPVTVFIQKYILVGQRHQVVKNYSYFMAKINTNNSLSKGIFCELLSVGAVFETV